MLPPIRRNRILVSLDRSVSVDLNLRSVRPQSWTDAKAIFDTVYEASKQIQTIAPHEKKVSAAV
jgi:hypothetical protein